MADKDQYNEEYHFSDSDDINPDVLEPDMGGAEEEVASDRPYKPAGSETNVRRNAIIAVVTLLLAFVLFRYIVSYFTSDELAQTPEPVQPRPQPVVTAPTPTPTPVAPSRVAPTPTTAAITDSRTVERLSSLEANQQNLQSSVSSVNSEVASLNATVNQLNSNISELNQVVSTLAQKMTEQSSQIELIISRSKPQKPTKIVHKVEKPVIRYYVQAVIPGRAWLIGSNGTTLTVREGTPIPGYGVVKLVDSNQGQVITSTGKIIRFSQQDS